MTQSIETVVPAPILDAALALAPNVRAALAEALLCSLDERVDPQLESEWAEEIARRVAAYERDPSTAIPGEQVMAEMRAKWPS